MIINCVFRKLIYIPIFFCTLGVTGQEGLRPLTYGGMTEGQRPVSSLQDGSARAASHSLQIPFKDDFSYSTRQHYPSTRFWSDSMAFINSGFGINPPSIGVATFDGLNKHGYPYVPLMLNLNINGPADTLTSLPIDLYIVAATSKTLQPSDSVGLTFQYQARGFGETPEAIDSLVVDLYKPRQDLWESRVWHSRGNSSGNIQDTVFKTAFIRISDTAYFHDGFRFRFRNKATAAGNFDHWNVDYVYLNTGLYNNNPVYDDITFAYVPSSYLKEYVAMPHQQYTSNDMVDRLNIRIRNNSSQIITMSYKHVVLNAASNQTLHTYSGGVVNLSPYSQSGYSKNSAHALPDIKSQYVLGDMLDSTDLIVKHFVYRDNTGQSSDFFDNDTILQHLRFRNYYAFDDGSAESGYYVNGSGSRLAVKIKLNNPDSLRAVRIYFDPAGTVPSAQNTGFDIKVWAESGNGPGTELYTESQRFVSYIKTGFKGIPEYSLNSRVYLTPGTYYIGFRQNVATGITIGFDRNNNFSRSMYFDSGNGWKQSSISGSFMMRPVFGAYVPPPVGVSEHNSITTSWKVYPNPADDELHFMSEDHRSCAYFITNGLGQVVLSGNSADGQALITTSGLERGLYILNIRSEGTASRHKFVVQH
jgi:hypothetical protein